MDEQTCQRRFGAELPWRWGRGEGELIERDRLTAREFVAGHLAAASQPLESVPGLNCPRESHDAAVIGPLDSR